MRRREFVALLGAVAGWPHTAHAQQLDRRRRIAAFQAGLTSGDPEGQAEVSALVEGLKDLGWKAGTNIDIDYYWPGIELDQIRSAANKVTGTMPDLVISRSTPGTAALINSGLPIVFMLVVDPLGAGFVQSLARPRGNATGFSNLESSMGGKWLQLLKEVAPETARVALLFNPVTAPFADTYLRSAEQAASPLHIAVKATPVRNGSDIELALDALATEHGGGFVIITDISLLAHRELIIGLAERHRLPAIYGSPTYAANGGLISYSVNFLDLYRRAADYADRILKGAKPADLPVQLPERFELAVNLKTAKNLGLSIPQTLLATADRVIE